MVDVTVSYPAAPSFLDANVFLFDVFAHPQFGVYCHTLLVKVEKGELQAITSVMVLDEVLFKMQVAEAAKTFNIPIGRASRFLKENPSNLSSLTQTWNNIKRIVSLPNLQIVEVSPDDFQVSLDLAQKHYLLPHDALHLAVMQRLKLTTIVSGDADFERIPSITVFKPEEDESDGSS